MEGNRLLELYMHGTLTTFQTHGNLAPRIFEDGEIKSLCIDVRNRSAVENHTVAALNQIRHYMFTFYPTNLQTYHAKRVSWQI